jgi:hypothetical protein
VYGVTPGMYELVGGMQRVDGSNPKFGKGEVRSEKSECRIAASKLILRSDL